MTPTRSRAVVGGLLYGLLLAFPVGARALFPGTPETLFPPLWLSALWAIPLAIGVFLRNQHNRLAALVWVAWFMLGSLNVVASDAVLPGYWALDVVYPDLVYITFTLAFFGGLLITEAGRSGPTRHAGRAGLDPLFTAALLAFPFAYAWSMHRTVGHFPLLQGIDLTRQMYEVDYGPLYGYSILLVLAALVALHRTLTAGSHTRRALYGFLVAMFLAISILDGKRFNLMLFLAGLLAYQLARRGAQPGQVRLFRSFALVGGLGILLYLGILVLRQGFNLDAYAGLALQAAALGVEHRDFVDSVVRYPPGSIPHYDWAGSAVAAALNSTLLAAFGIDKTEQVLRGSAYIWMNLRGGEFGIRTGIVSELYLAYGWLGLAPMLAVGLLAGFLTRGLRRARTERALVFGCAVFATLLLIPVGQTTATTGVLSVVFYAFVVSALTLRLTGTLDWTIPHHLPAPAARSGPLQC